MHSADDVLEKIVEATRDRKGELHILPIFLSKPPLEEKEAHTLGTQGEGEMWYAPNAGGRKTTFDAAQLFKPLHYTLAFDGGAFHSKEHRGEMALNPGTAIEYVEKYYFGLEGASHRATTDHHMIILPKKEYHDMAVTCLTMMANPKRGAELLNYSDPDAYRETLSMGEGAVSYDVAKNLLAHGGLTKEEATGIIREAVKHENMELAAIVGKHIKGISDDLGQGKIGPKRDED